MTQHRPDVIPLKNESAAPSQGQDEVMAILRDIRLRLVRLEREFAQPRQEWFNIKDASALTGLSTDHIRRHVTAGLLPAINHGSFEKPYYVPHRPDIDRWMAERREAPQPAPRKRKKSVPGPGSYSSRHHPPRASA